MDFIMQMRPLFGAEEKKALCEYMDEDGFLTEFKRTEKFEQMIAEFTGAKHCIVVNNGTISLTLAALSVGIKADDEVLVPNYAMIATPNSVKMFGAKPIFVDVERETLCMDIQKARKAITAKTKAIMLVSANGRSPKAGIEAFKNLCKENGLILIEDAAQSLGSFYPNGKHIGTKGLVGSFSFSAPKIISTGQGGALITNDDKIASNLRKLKDFGRSQGGNDFHDSIGYNFKFTELQACVGIEQMKKLSLRIKRKKELYGLYKKGLDGISQVQIFDQDLQYTTPWFYDILCEDRKGLIEFLKQNNIGTRLMYGPINKQIAYQVKGEYEVSNLVGEKGLWLPSAVQLKDDEIQYICEKIREFYQ
ncbi:DegT/DnrJ/EryC1/StrS aminotransferase family protein [Campylobacter sp. MIT 12-5580]|uniref:DegT/DnrJ/EryC1/StrS family aminotransferase n=1 Tax=Campylobacter sp. MIT 12-5580 TaxID=2040651 RepID=UPI001BB1CB26|nr:DegT/DnrJ/EryC1/StrS aminotransferase family protein [Campylobacter sp. MIT 12-5580]